MQPLFPLPVVICYWVDVIKETPEELCTAVYGFCRVLLFVKGQSRVLLEQSNFFWHCTTFPLYNWTVWFLFS